MPTLCVLPATVHNLTPAASARAREGPGTYIIADARRAIPTPWIRGRSARPRCPYYEELCLTGSAISRVHVARFRTAPSLFPIETSESPESTSFSGNLDNLRPWLKDDEGDLEHAERTLFALARMVEQHLQAVRVFDREELLPDQGGKSLEVLEKQKAGLERRASSRKAPRERRAPGRGAGCTGPLPFYLCPTRLWRRMRKSLGMRHVKGFALSRE